MSTTVPRRRNNRDIDDTSSSDVSTIQRSSHTPSAASANDIVANERGWYMYASFSGESPLGVADDGVLVNQICFRAKSICALSWRFRSLLPMITPP